MSFCLHLPGAWGLSGTEVWHMLMLMDACHIPRPFLARHDFPIVMLAHHQASAFASD